MTIDPRHPVILYLRRRDRRRKPCRLAELHEHTGIPLRTLGRHVRALADAGLVVHEPYGAVSLPVEPSKPARAPRRPAAAQPRRPATPPRIAFPTLPATPRPAAPTAPPAPRPSGPLHPTPPRLAVALPAGTCPVCLTSTRLHHRIACPAA